MKKALLTLLVLAAGTLTHAQEISHAFKDESLSDALRQLNELSTDYTIHFLYNELEDFRITTTIAHKTVPDAIRQMIGFYPVRMTIVSDDDPEVHGKQRHQIIVECTHKTDHRLVGNIIDEQGRPVAYANIAILNPADSTLLGGGVSNESGYFAVPYEQPHVLARISHIGYQTVYRLCDKPAMGVVRMQPEAQRLKGVTVKGQTPVLRREAGVILFDTRHIAGAINAKDLLQYAPGVVIHHDDISLFGTSGVLFCINGKEQKMPAREMLQILQTYPASEVARIEIVQSPGVGYSPEGNAGVINIVLNKHGKDYIGGSLSYARTQYEQHGDEANANLIYKKGRISTSLNVAGTWEHTVYRETNTIDFPGVQRLNIDNGLISKNNRALRWQTDYQASSKLNLGAYVMYAAGERHLDIDGLYDYLPKAADSLSNFNTQTRRKEETKTWAVNMNAVQKLGDGGAKMEFNLDYYRMRMGDGRHSASQATYIGHSPNVTQQSDTADFDYQNKIAQTVDNYSAKIDVSLAGFKFGSQYVCTRSHLDLGYSGMNNYNHVTTLYDEHVWAGYAEYGRTFGDAWSMHVGGRYEHVWTKGENHPVAYDSNSSYGKFFPSLHIGYHPNDTHSFNWSVSSRITRPNIINLNPNRVWKDVNHVSSGNQNLKPSCLYKAMMGYTYKGVLSMDLYYAFQADRVDAVHGVDKQVTYSTWDNITDEHAFGINTFYYFDKLPWMTATLMQGVSYSKTIRSPGGRDAGLAMQSLYSQVENISYSAMLQASFFFDSNRKWVANLHAAYNSREKDVAMKLDARYMVDVGLRYRFWKDRLTLGLACRNLFASPVKGEEYLRTTVMDFNNKFNYRQFHLTLSYHWGAPLHHNKRRYESDDMQERIVNDF